MNVENIHKGILSGRNVVVLMGGPGSEREVSLRSGAAVALALAQAGANVSQADVRDASFVLPDAGCLAFNCIHGTFGEDGQLQELLEARDIPYTGENAECSRIAFDKILTKRRFNETSTPTPDWHVLKRGESPDFSLPFVVKAPRQGSSVGVHIVRESAEFAPAMEDCLSFGDEVLIEKFVTGRELTVGVLGSQALPIVEIVPLQGFYDYTNKYTKGASSYFCPAELSPEETVKVQAAALKAHLALGLEIYSRVDVLLAADGSASVLEVNTIPGMTETSLLPKAAAAAGLDFPSLCEMIAGLSLGRGGTR